MTGRGGVRAGGRRPAVAVIAVLLAALLHVLVCAHGPLGAGAADALPAGAARCAVAAAAGGGGAPAGHSHDGGRRDACTGADQPVTVHQPGSSVEAPAELAVSAPVPDGAPRAGGADVPAEVRGAGGRGRASLGVWRT
ncbi:hypothetical protein AB0O31_02395 [Kitasatospora cineracea]|uniref:hypothetical protein n=1 Tax=Kitasatospora cineracea TaxID=88074 RepID=UPI00342D69D6